MRAIRHTVALMFLVTAPLAGIVTVFTLVFGCHRDIRAGLFL